MAKQKKSVKTIKSKKKLPLHYKDSENITGLLSTKENPLFCTECDKELDAFWKSNKSKDPEAVRKNHENCKKIGKFKGEFCSKLFIIDKDTLEGIWMEDEG